jgi:hypothetical protein
MAYSETPTEGVTVKNVKLKLQQAWEENPLAVITVGALAVTAAAKLLDSTTAAKNSRAWKKEVDRRDRASRS